MQAEQNAANLADGLNFQEPRPTRRMHRLLFSHADYGRPFQAWERWSIIGVVLMAHLLLLMQMRAPNHTEPSRVRTQSPVIVTLSTPPTSAAPQTPPKAPMPARPKPSPVPRQQPAAIKPKVQAKPKIEPKPVTPEPAESQASPPASERPSVAEKPPIVAAPEQGQATPPAPVSAAGPPTISPPRFQADYLHNPAPAYPALSARRGEQGKVMLRVQVSAQGQALQVELAQSSGFSRLDQAAQEAVRRWRFIPARQGEQAVEAWVIVPVNFKLASSR